MSISTQILLNKYQSYMNKLIRMMKKSNSESLRTAYQQWEEESLRLMQYIAMPSMSDEEFINLTIY